MNDLRRCRLPWRHSCAARAPWRLAKSNEADLDDFRRAGRV